MKILVTGGSGFIGSALIRYILKNTADVIVNVDKLTYAANKDFLKNSNEDGRYFFEHVDICCAAELQRVFNTHQPDAVMHLAAESHVDRSISGPKDFIQTNIVGTYELLEAARFYWQSLSTSTQQDFRFHHISTDEVYGDLADSDGFFVESTPYAPSSPYSASKASSDHLVRVWQRTYGLPVLITNCSNNYGPYQFPEKLIPRIIFRALSGEPLTIYGDGLQVRDWLYVDDHVEALYQVLKHGAVGDTYNIGGFNEKTNLEVVTSICSLLDELLPATVQGLTNYIDLLTYVEDRAGHDRRYAIDATKIKQKLGWEPKESFESGLRKTVKWYLDNRAWGQENITHPNQEIITHENRHAV